MDILLILKSFNSFVWGYPLIVLLLGTGLYFTIRLGLIQILKLPLAISIMWKKPDPNAKKQEGDVSPFAALCTALSATIGTGNIVGVATAITAGGPGALFWMWIAAFLGMTTKYAECLLAVKYRKVDANGQMAGGPMYYIEHGIKNKFFAKILAKAFAIFAIGAACLGIGTMTQVNAIKDAAVSTFHVPVYAVAIVVTALIGMVILGGIKSIASVSMRIVPFMAVFYVIGCLTVLGLNTEKIIPAILLIVDSAFNPQAAFGAGTGILIMTVMQTGVARGIFSNEAGLGSAPIAAAAAKTDSCVEQGLLGMTGVFIDTIIICTMTGLVLVLTGAWNTPGYSGLAVTGLAFNTGMAGIATNVGQIVVNIGLMFFAFTTIIGWSYYGERCAEYLFGIKSIFPFRLIYLCFVAIGPFLALDVVWIIADILNGLMAFPNLVGLLALSGVVISETKLYLAKIAAEKKEVKKSAEQGRLA